ncbi:hypothetical protein HD806DRAFT_162248 [Xylariaceae sp. AK1471]|nr:hypothetical protein HD806DRAFT_162248 [Xylariaceae sp. AK1471]
MLEVFHRRCHPDPEKALQEFRWRGRDLHTQRRYLALRLRFRGQPYGYMIAHDVHDAVKESRKRTRQREKAAKKQAKRQRKRGNKTEWRPTAESAVMPAEQEPYPSSLPAQYPDTIFSQLKTKRKKSKEGKGVKTIRETQAVPSSGNEEAHNSGEGSQLQNAETTSTSKAKRRITKILTTISPNPGTTAAEPSVSGNPDLDPFQDPPPELQPKKAKKTKVKAMKGKATSNNQASPQKDPFRDPDVESMRLIDADDFRLTSGSGSNANTNIKTTDWPLRNDSRSDAPPPPYR